MSTDFDPKTTPREKTDAEIYKDVGKHRWPYVDEPRPVPRLPRGPDSAAAPVENSPKPHPLTPGALADVE